MRLPLTLILAIVVWATACGREDRSLPAQTIDVAVSLIQERAYYADAVDWQAIRPIVSRARDSGDPAEVHAAIRRVIVELNDGHSRFHDPAAVQKRAAAEPGALPTGHRQHGVGYLRLPAWRDLSTDPRTAEYESTGRDWTAEEACGWIVDLRNNTGGNLPPMIPAVADLLGPGTAIRYRDRDRIDTTYTIGDDGSVEIELPNGDVIAASAAAPAPLQPFHGPVAVLIGRETASAGEGVALAFRSRADVRLFGASTAGAVTGVAGHKLPDGSVLALAETVPIDATGRVQTGPIEPDYDAPPGTGAEPIGDPTSRAAAEWLDSQCDTS